MSEMSWAFIGELLDRSDEQGILSIYVESGMSGSDEWRIKVRNELNRLCDEQDSRERRMAFKATMDRVWEELPDRVARMDGRGLVGFVEVHGKAGDDTWLELQLPVPTLVHYNVKPYVGPLISILDDSPHTGIVCASNEIIRMYDWKQGGLTEILEFEFQHDLDEWKRIEGGSHGGNASAAHMTSATEKFLNTLKQERVDYLVKVVAPTVGEWAQQLGWERVVAFGPAVFRTALAQLLEKSGSRARFVDAGEAIIAREPRADLLGRIDPILADDNRQREKELVTSAIERAEANQAGALGREELEKMLDERRVSHLLVASPLSLDTNGTGASVERLIAEAIRSGGKVTPVEGDAAAMLGPVGGVAALLHW